MQRKLRNIVILTLTTSSLLFTSIAYGGQGGSSVIEIEGENIEVSTTTVPIFDNAIDKAYYEVFRDGFEFMQEHSQQLNRVAHYDGLRMEIISNITVTEQGAFGSGPSNRSYVFFTLQDETGNRVSADMQLGLDNRYLNEGDWSYAWGRVWLVDFDEDTKTAMFVAEFSFHYDNREDMNTTQHINMVIDGMAKDIVLIDEAIESINIYELVNSHKPAFEDHEISGGMLSRSAREDFDIDWDDIMGYSTTLVKDELQIEIIEYTYISNIALKGNMLHIQFNQNRELYNGNIDRNDMPKFAPWYYVTQLVNVNTGETIYPLYSLVLNNHDEELKLIDNTDYEEYVFYIEDLNELPNYYFNLVGSYFETLIDLNLLDAFYSPVLSQSIRLEEEIEVMLGGKEANVRNIEASYSTLTFDLEQAGITDIFWEMAWSEQIDFLRENIDIILKFQDGTEIHIDNESLGWGSPWGFQEEDIITFHIRKIIDIDSLRTISINGVEVNVR